MSRVEVYRALAGRERVMAAAAAAPSPFTIEVRFIGGLTDVQKAAFKNAANRWSRVIVGDLPSVAVDGEVIDDVLILAEGAEIDGRGNILGQAGPTHLRPPGAGRAAFLPAKGIMTFDSADLEEMEMNGTLNDVITHEMGHVIGMGSIWVNRKLLKGAGGVNPVFTGASGRSEYGRLKGSGPADIPVENGRSGNARFALAGERFPDRADDRVGRRGRKCPEPDDGGQLGGPRLRSGLHRGRRLRASRASGDRRGHGQIRSRSGDDVALDSHGVAARKPAVTRRHAPFPEMTS
jgi:hypothetical protein